MLFHVVGVVSIEIPLAITANDGENKNLLTLLRQVFSLVTALTLTFVSVQLSPIIHFPVECN